MKVSVNLLVNLRQYTPDGGGDVFELELAPETSAGMVHEALGLPAKLQTVILVNGRHATADTPLSHGDALTLYPTMAGG